jgi:hypothetical protein
MAGQGRQELIYIEKPYVLRSIRGDREASQGWPET